MSDLSLCCVVSTCQPVLMSFSTCQSVLMSFLVYTHVTWFEGSVVGKDGRIVVYDLEVISLFYLICSERT
jgi:hypothetical protein